MREQRSEERITVSNEVEVADALTGGHVGLLGNVSSGGMMLITKRPFELGGVMQLRLMLPESVREQEHIDVGAQCAWLEQSTVQNTFYAGFSIVDISADDRLVLDVLCLP